jgi:AcrR family transcriptional regulator
VPAEVRQKCRQKHRQQRGQQRQQKFGRSAGNMGGEMRLVRQLGREDWIAAGLAALAAGGPTAFRVEAVARALGVSKGSFYWHFRDRAAWRDALLDWVDHRVSADLVHRARGQAALSAPQGLPPGLARALRDWGQEDLAVALCLQRLAAERRGPDGAAPQAQPRLAG